MLAVFLCLVCPTGGCGISQARMERDARKVAELDHEFWELAQVSLGNLTNDKTKERRDELAAQIKYIKKPYAADSVKQTFEQLVEQYKAELH